MATRQLARSAAEVSLHPPLSFVGRDFNPANHIVPSVPVPPCRRLSRRTKSAASPPNPHQTKCHTMPSHFRPISLKTNDRHPDEVSHLFKVGLPVSTQGRAPEATRTGLPVSTASGAWEIDRAREIKRAWETNREKTARPHLYLSRRFNCLSRTQPRDAAPTSCAMEGGVSTPPSAMQLRHYLSR